MTPDIESIVKVQGLDLRAADLQREIASLPKHIAVIERTLESHTKKLEADRALQMANQKERRQVEGDVKVHEQKISKLRDQMMSAKTNEQYKAFQHEIQFCEDAIRKCEDRTLELMEETETLDRNVKAAEAQLKAEKEQVEREKAAARERTAADQRQLDEIVTERKALISSTGRAILADYERLRRRSPNVVVDATAGRCSACHLELRPQLFQELRKGDTLLHCENCKRILYYNPPVAFDAANGGPAPAGDGSRVDMS